MKDRLLASREMRTRAPVDSVVRVSNAADGCPLVRAEAPPPRRDAWPPPADQRKKEGATHSFAASVELPDQRRVKVEHGALFVWGRSRHHQHYSLKSELE